MGNAVIHEELSSKNDSLRRSKRTHAKLALKKIQKQSDDVLFNAINLYGKKYYAMSDYDTIDTAQKSISSSKKTFNIKYMWLPQTGFLKDGIDCDIGVPIIFDDLDNGLYIEEMPSILRSHHDFIQSEMKKKNIKSSYTVSDFNTISNYMREWRKITAGIMKQYQKGQIVLLDPLSVPYANTCPLGRIQMVFRREYNHNIDIIHLQSVSNVLKPVRLSSGTIDRISILKVFNDDETAMQYLQTLRNAHNAIISTASTQEMEDNARRIGIDIDGIKLAARKQGHKECATVEVKQKIIYLCTNLNGKLTATISKRSSRPHTTTKITMNSMTLTGFDTFKSISSSWENENYLWWFNNLDWKKLAAIVGVDLLYKYQNGKQIYYADDINVEYSEMTHVANLYFTVVRWTPAKKHRHRVIPPLGDINIDK